MFAENVFCLRAARTWPTHVNQADQTMRSLLTCVSLVLYAVSSTPSLVSEEITTRMIWREYLSHVNLVGVGKPIEFHTVFRLPTGWHGHMLNQLAADVQASLAKMLLERSGWFFFSISLTPQVQLRLSKSSTWHPDLLRPSIVSRQIYYQVCGTSTGELNNLK